jgi:subtilisin-like proprotein convertase family protein
MASTAYYYVSGQKVYLEEVDGEAAVRYREVNAVRRGLVSPDFGRALQAFERVEEIPDARLTILRSKRQQHASEIKRELIGFDEVTYVTPVYQRPQSGEKVVLTSKFICQFKPEVTRADIDAMNAQHHVQIESQEPYAPNCYVLRLQDDAAETVLEVANAYQESGKVIFSHPDIIAPRSFRVPEPLFAQQWHLKNTGQSGGSPGADIKVEGAWQVTAGRPEVIIAVIDDGMDMQHPDLAEDGKVVAPTDIRSGLADPSPRREYENHGTAVCGVAAASRQDVGVTGVAPGCRLMPIRLDGGPILEARAFSHAAQNGAWVINCSWGPADGAWWDPDDPLHQQVAPLPDNVRAAIDFAVTQGRGGKGCVITWAAGNGNEAVSNDGYASYPKVIAVAASSHEDRKAAYSDFGPEISVTAPSNHFTAGGQAVGGIWTTDRMGNAGYNEGEATKGDTAGLYTNSFGGTSSAAPTVAGVAALVLSANPTLSAAEVKRILEDTADRIDPAGGQWTASDDGRLHSPFYGYGRVNAEKAVAEARRRPGADTGDDIPHPPSDVTSSTTPVAIADFPAAAVLSSMTVQAAGAIADLAVSVEIEHTWVGDLAIALVAPDGTTAVLQDRHGGSQQNLAKTYDLAHTPALQSFVGRSLQGNWSLKVQDMAARDTGRLVRWALRHATTAPAAAAEVLSAELAQALMIPDHDPIGIVSSLELAGTGTVADIRVDVDLTHTYVGDIRVALVPPSGHEVVLRPRSGGNADNIIESYTPATTPGLATMIAAGERIGGPWKLKVSDQAARDVGKLNRWKIAVRK